ncbi:unnamed protein product [Clonostachys byssicola]|uniref:Uncharacterized protein n=1 Tax=Clonostachys byssicola TaxID=160290 RepID=A0A9N9UK03_9HYPO|nr:unnamed protein product [Clonostachys byssicola]
MFAQDPDGTGGTPGGRAACPRSVGWKRTFEASTSRGAAPRWWINAPTIMCEAPKEKWQSEGMYVEEARSSSC